VLSNFGPDNGHVSHPDYGLLMASQDLLAHELLAYAWLKWNREFETHALSRASTGQLTHWRSTLNKLLVRMVWESQREEKTPGIPFFEAGDIYRHPSIVNFIRRKGGRPETLVWEQVNTGPDNSVASYLSGQLQLKT
jgi:hypothetical protein